MGPFWKIPPPGLSLSKSDLHIWLARLDLVIPIVQKLNQTLSTDESERAERFRFEQDRKNSIVSQGILRTILGCYLNLEPSRVRFCYGKHGKPRLADAIGNGTIHFNLSHSAGIALYGFTRDYEIGVDIERIHGIPEMDQIVEEFFSMREKDVFRSLPEDMKKEAFFNCWTRKEAFMKAIGEGLFYPLNRFDVSFSPDEPSRLLSIDGDPEKASQWFVLSLKPAAGFTAALAIKGHGWRLHFWQWPDQPTSNLAYQQRPKWLSVKNEKILSWKHIHIPGSLSV
jgi:4'-phosphopantetheinyl transferase